MAYKAEEKLKAIKMFYEGNSARAVGRVFGFSKANVLRWIRERADQIPPNQSVENDEKVPEIEMDELFWYIKKGKNTNS